MTRKSDQKPSKPSRFISLRWRFISPLFLVILIVAVIGAYFLARNIPQGVRILQENVLLQNSRTTLDRTNTLYKFHRDEALRVAFTIGVPEAIRDRRIEALQSILETLMRISDLDAVIVTDRTGVEVFGLQRVVTAQGEQLAVSTETDLSEASFVRDVLNTQSVGLSELSRSPLGMMVFTGVPVYLGDEFIGVAAVGQSLTEILLDLKASASTDLAFYGPQADLLQTTFASDNRDVLVIGQEVFIQALGATRNIPVQQIQLDGSYYNTAFQPFIFGPTTLGVIGVIMRDNLPFVTETGRQLTGLFAATVAGIVVTFAYIGITRITTRANRVSSVARDLKAGQQTARTLMKPTDEISAIGYALDQYAEYTQERQDALRQALRRQRREANHLMVVLESIPEGVVVQGLDGRVILMNNHARDLLGSQRVFRSSGIHELSEIVGDRLGASLAPGIYALGDPHRIHLDERIVSAQAAAITSLTDQRLGTVMLIRDITNQVRLEQQRDAMIQQLARDIQQPLTGLGRLGSSSQDDMVRAFARQITRQAAALQKMIVDMRELDTIGALEIKRRQQPLSLETLLWAVANEWRQVAQANGLSLHIIIEQTGLFILGDEKRLRWAIGNIIDNAIKYNQPGGALTLEIKAEAEGMGHLRVRDNGVGIAREERQFIFTRFYRGTPVARSGVEIRVPGMGQGLHIARRIFEAHGGSIRIKSSQEVGTAVYMSLPLTAAEGMALPIMQFDMDGETVQLPENLLIELD